MYLISIYRYKNRFIIKLSGCIILENLFFNIYIYRIYFDAQKISTHFVTKKKKDFIKHSEIYSRPFVLKIAITIIISLLNDNIFIFYNSSDISTQPFRLIRNSLMLVTFSSSRSRQPCLLNGFFLMTLNRLFITDQDRKICVFGRGKGKRP